jgi:hypothetical protein
MLQKTVTMEDAVKAAALKAGEEEQEEEEEYTRCGDTSLYLYLHQKVSTLDL